MKKFSPFPFIQTAASSPVAVETAQDSLNNAPDETNGSISPFGAISMIAVAALVVIGVFLPGRRKSG